MRRQRVVDGKGMPADFALSYAVRSFEGRTTLVCIAV